MDGSDYIPKQTALRNFINAAENDEKATARAEAARVAAAEADKALDEARCALRNAYKPRSNIFVRIPGNRIVCISVSSVHVYPVEDGGV